MLSYAKSRLPVKSVAVNRCRTHDEYAKDLGSRVSSIWVYIQECDASGMVREGSIKMQVGVIW